MGGGSLGGLALLFVVVMVFVGLVVLAIGIGIAVYTVGLVLPMIPEIPAELGAYTHGELSTLGIVSPDLVNVGIAIFVSIWSIRIGLLVLRWALNLIGQSMFASHWDQGAVIIAAGTVGE